MFLKDLIMIPYSVDRLQKNFMYQKWMSALELIMNFMWSYFLHGPPYHFHSGSGADTIFS